MPIYGTIKEDTKRKFFSAFAAHFSLDPAGSEWTSLAEALGYVSDHEDFKHTFGWSQMVIMLRQLCEARGLTREDRGEPPHVTEGYYGLTRKQ